MFDFFEFSNEMLCVADHRGYFVRVNQIAPTTTVRVMYTGHSFAGGPHEWLGLLTKQASIVGYESLGRQALGALGRMDNQLI